jgi:hypothetical protein
MAHARRKYLQMPCQQDFPAICRGKKLWISAAFRLRSGKAGKFLPVGGKLLPA